MQLSYPSDVKKAAASLDRKVLEMCVGSQIPEGRESDCVIEGPGAPSTSSYGLSFQQVVTRLPIKMGGMGLRSQEQLRYAAFVGAVEQCVPHLGISWYQGWSVSSSC